MDISQILIWIKKLFTDGSLDFLETLDEETISPLAMIFNLNPKIVADVCNVLPPLIKGEISIKTAIPKLLPVLLPLILKSRQKNVVMGEQYANNNDKNSEKPTYSPTFEENKTASEEILPLADNEVLNSINDYLHSFSAS